MSFDRLAPHYRRLERLLAGDRLQRCRLAHLEAIRDARQILLLGEGPGRFLAELRRRAPAARVTCLDSSPRMLACAAGQLPPTGPDSGAVTFLQADALSWSPPEQTFDLVVTHFFLDCFRESQLADLVPRLARGLGPGGRWLVSEFRLPSGALRRLQARVQLWLAYRFFRMVARLPANALPDPDSLLIAAGFRLTAHCEFDHGFLRSDLWERVSPRPRVSPDLPGPVPATSGGRAVPASRGDPPPAAPP